MHVTFRPTFVEGSNAFKARRYIGLLYSIIHTLLFSRMIYKASSRDAAAMLIMKKSASAYHHVEDVHSFFIFVMSPHYTARLTSAAPRFRRHRHVTRDVQAFIEYRPVFYKPLYYLRALRCFCSGRWPRFHGSQGAPSRRPGTIARPLRLRHGDATLRCAIGHVARVARCWRWPRAHF